MGMKNNNAAIHNSVIRPSLITCIKYIIDEGCFRNRDCSVATFVAQ